MVVSVRDGQGPLCRPARAVACLKWSNCPAPARTNTHSCEAAMPITSRHGSEATRVLHTRGRARQLYPRVGRDRHRPACAEPPGAQAGGRTAPEPAGAQRARRGGHRCRQAIAGARPRHPAPGRAGPGGHEPHARSAGRPRCRRAAAQRGGRVDGAAGAGRARAAARGGALHHRKPLDGNAGIARHRPARHRAALQPAAFLRCGQRNGAGGRPVPGQRHQGRRPDPARCPVAAAPAGGPAAGDSHPAQRDPHRWSRRSWPPSDCGLGSRWRSMASRPSWRWWPMARAMLCCRAMRLPTRGGRSATRSGPSSSRAFAAGSRWLPVRSVRSRARSAPWGSCCANSCSSSSAVAPRFRSGDACRRRRCPHFGSRSAGRACRRHTGRSASTGNGRSRRPTSCDAFRCRAAPCAACAPPMP